ncbi:glycosyltransferase [Desertihabitans brevis]|uniref:Glycosyltransferase n=1 Tax=Desertihabitans brevis TaxID=2268447 RepID=A0A367YVZ6_9ACTN|nr:glycosyltransferase family 4 protein [Desertihabitans brevis]RCK69141.1 glycosyltransferase [Desertihabitans brevis]
MTRRLRRIASRALRSASRNRAAVTQLVKDPNKQARREATRLWKAGKREASLEVLRRALLQHGHDATTWHVYGSRMLQTRRPDVALEAFKNAVELDPTRTESLELLQNMADRKGAKSGRVDMKQALDRLAAAVPGRTEIHRDALSLFIQSDHQKGLAALASSQDPVVKLALRLNGAPQEEWPRLATDAETGTFTMAQVFVLLARGGINKAGIALEGVPNDLIPVFSVRLALRKALRKGQNGRAQTLLRHYRRARPDDAWAKRKLLETEVSDEEGQRILEKGFQFPTGRRPAPYTKRPERIFYNVHASLPYHSAGYAARTHGVLSALRRAGWDVEGVTRLGYPFDMAGRKPESEIPAVDQVDGVTYRRLTTTPDREPKHPVSAYIERYSSALERLADDRRPAVLHAATNYRNGLAAVVTGRRLGIPSIYEVRGLWEITRVSRDPFWSEGDKFKLTSRLELDAAAGATRVMAITNALKDEMVRRGIPAEKIDVVPNGVDTERFLPVPRDEALARRLGLEGKVVIGYVGSLLEYEGLDLLVQAAAELQRERDDFAVLVVGDGPDSARLRDQVDKARLGGVVQFAGRVPHDEVESYYSVIDLCPLPRLPLPVCEMVSPLKPFEAMAMGKVVVASDVAALAEIVEDGSNGMLFTKGDVVSLTSKLRTLLDDAELRGRLSSQARDWVVQHRRWDVLARGISEIYEDLGARRASA